MKSKILIILCAWFAMQSLAFAKEGLPATVQAEANIPLQKVGEGTYRKFGFGIYHAVLWAPGGAWNMDQPYALELHYLRGLSQDTLANSVVDDIRGQNVADDETMTRWTASIKKIMPAVQDGDVMTGLIGNDKEAVLFLNGVQITKIEDKALSKAFLNIWLGKDADEDLKNELLGQKAE